MIAMPPSTPRNFFMAINGVHDILQAAPETVEQHVRRLLASWREQTGFLSSSTARVTNPAYRELIALGAAALPFLFDDMAQTFDGHLSSALVAITGAQPVPLEQGGKIPKVAERWLAWAREHGY
jgi:hypothetical protein